MMNSEQMAQISRALRQVAKELESTGDDVHATTVRRLAAKIWEMPVKETTNA